MTNDGYDQARALIADGKFVDAACLLLELGDRDGVVDIATKVHYSEYWMERLRDEPDLAPMASDPRWSALLADLDPPAHTDLASALADPQSVRTLRLRDLPEFPDDIVKCVNLEVLDLWFLAYPKLPAGMVSLPKLRKLRLRCPRTRREVDLPDGLLAMPSLREVELWESRTPKKYHQGQINAMLAGLARANAPERTRALHAALLLRDEDRAVAEGDVRDLVLALDSNVAPVRTFALRVLERKLGDVALRIEPGGEMLVVGKLNLDRATLAERLDRLGATLGTSVGPATCAVIVGEQPKGKAVRHLDSGVPVALEVHLCAALDAGHLAAGGDTEVVAQLGRLLTSRDTGNVRLALTMMTSGGVPTGVHEELLLAMHDPDLDKKVRAEAKRLFAQTPRELQDAVDDVFRRSSIHAAAEARLSQRIKAVAEQANGAIDPVKLATLLLAYGRGYLYLMDSGPAELVVRALTGIRANGFVDLSGNQLDTLPAAFADVPGVRRLNLARNHFTAIPDPVLGVATLETLNVAYNRLTTVPDAIARLTNLRGLDLSRNHFTQFPEAVFGATGLRVLDVSTEPHYYGNQHRPLSDLPAGIGALTELEELRLMGHEFDELPDSMRQLTKLHTLVLEQAAVSRLPEWLVELPALTELNLHFTHIEERSTVADVLSRLRTRGVQISGVLTGEDA